MTQCDVIGARGTAWNKHRKRTGSSAYGPGQIVRRTPGSSHLGDCERRPTNGSVGPASSAEARAC
eukprot:8527913-Alexandrium_andersonii.AAC.1